VVSSRTARTPARLDARSCAGTAIGCLGATQPQPAVEAPWTGAQCRGSPSVTRWAGREPLACQYARRWRRLDAGRWLPPTHAMRRGEYVTVIPSRSEKPTSHLSSRIAALADLSDAMSVHLAARNGPRADTDTTREAPSGICGSRIGDSSNPSRMLVEPSLDDEISRPSSQGRRSTGNLATELGGGGDGTAQRISDSPRRVRSITS
jgi:hypothetical protein